MNSLPPWPIVQSMLLTVVLPGFGLGAGVLLAVCAVERSEYGRRMGALLALACGLTAGNLARGLLPWFSIEPGWISLYPATIVALGGAAEVLSARHGRKGKVAVRLFTAALCAAWLMPSDTWAFRIGGFLVILAAGLFDWGAWGLPGRLVHPRALLALTLLWGLAAATVLIHAHSAKLCDLAVLQTATVAGVGGVALLRKLDVATALAGSTAFLPALMFGGATSTYSDVPLASFILVALVPCAWWGLQALPLRSTRAMTTAAVMAGLIPCAIAVGLAMRAETLDFGN